MSIDVAERWNIAMTTNLKFLEVKCTSLFGSYGRLNNMQRRKGQLMGICLPSLGKQTFGYTDPSIAPPEASPFR